MAHVRGPQAAQHARFKLQRIGGHAVVETRRRRGQVDHEGALIAGVPGAGHKPELHQSGQRAADRHPIERHVNADVAGG